MPADEPPAPAELLTMRLRRWSVSAAEFGAELAAGPYAAELGSFVHELEELASLAEFSADAIGTV